MGEQIYNSALHDYYTRWSRVVSIEPWPFYSGKAAPSSHWIGDRLDLGTCLDTDEEKDRTSEAQPAVRPYTD